MKFKYKKFLWIIPLLGFSFLAIKWLSYHYVNQQSNNIFIELQDVPEISEYALSQRGIIYTAQKVKRTNHPGLYIFSISPIHTAKFSKSIYIFESSSNCFNQVIKEFNYITNRKSTLHNISNAFKEGLKGIITGPLNVITHPIDFATSIKNAPGYLCDSAKDFAKDANISNILKSFYINQLRKKAQENDLNFDSIYLEETKENLESDVKADLIGKSAAEIAPLLIPVGMVVKAGGKALSVASDGAKIAKYTEKGAEIAGEEAKIKRFGKAIESERAGTKVEGGIEQEAKAIESKSQTDILAKNREAGLAREKAYLDKLKKRYPESKGYKVQTETYLRDKNGKTPIALAPRM